MFLHQLFEGLAPVDKADLQSKRKELQRIQMDPQTSKDPQLKAELLKRKAELEKHAAELELHEYDDSEGVAEGLKFNGGFPDVDHMPGAVHKYGSKPSAPSSKKFFSDKAEWEQAVNDINSSVYDDNSDFISRNGIYEVHMNDFAWAKWSDKQNKGYIDMGAMSEGKKDDGKIAGRYHPDDFDQMVLRLKQRAQEQERKHGPVDLAALAKRLRGIDQDGRTTKGS